MSLRPLRSTCRRPSGRRARTWRCYSRIRRLEKRRRRAGFPAALLIPFNRQHHHVGRTARRVFQERQQSAVRMERRGHCGFLLVGQALGVAGAVGALPVDVERGLPIAARRERDARAVRRPDRPHVVGGIERPSRQRVALPSHRSRCPFACRRGCRSASSRPSGEKLGLVQFDAVLRSVDILPVRSSHRIGACLGVISPGV